MEDEEEGEVPEGQQETGQGDFWAQANADLNVELSLENELLETSMRFYASGVDEEQLRLASVATLQNSYNFLIKYKTAIRPMKNGGSLLDELERNIDLLNKYRGFGMVSLWELYNAERKLVLTALGEDCEFRKAKKRNFSWMRKKKRKEAGGSGE